MTLVSSASNKRSINTPNSIGKLEVVPGKIQTGQGDYIIFHVNGTEISKKTFSKAYKIFEEFSLYSIAFRKDLKGDLSQTEICSHRFNLIKNKIAKIDPDLRIVWVPRTLFELIYIRKCIKEDAKREEVCPNIVGRGRLYKDHIEYINSENIEEKKDLPVVNRVKSENEIKEKCWHPIYIYCDLNNSAGKYKVNKEIIDLAYRLNKVMIKTLDPQEDGFTFEDFSELAKKEIKFLKKYYKNFRKQFKKNGKQLSKDDKKYFSYISSPVHFKDYDETGPAVQFGFDKGILYPVFSMGIAHKSDAKLVKNALKLDCSRIASEAFIFYRGSNFKKDGIEFDGIDNQTYCFSLSFGTSLFAGCVHDPGATAFPRIKHNKNGYVVTVPVEDAADSPFYIPNTNTIAQLLSTCELFHVRTKTWKEAKHGPAGVQGFTKNRKILHHLNLSQKELVSEFEKYKSQAIQIKKH